MFGEEMPAMDETWMVVYFGEEPTTTVHRVCMDEVPDEEDGHEVELDAAFPDVHGYLLEHPMCAYPGPNCPDEVE